MKLCEYMDYGDREEVFVDGIGEIAVIGGTVQINYYRICGTERRLVLPLRWEINAWKAAIGLFFKAQDFVAQESNWREAVKNVH